MSPTPSPIADLRDPTHVPFDKVFLDPNNPRIAQEYPPGYRDVSKLFDPNAQPELEARVRDVYQGVEELQNSIIKQGWIPIDPIIVWEHPQKKGFYVVVEGNTRTVALRYLRGSRLEREQKLLDKMKSSANSAKHTVATQEQLVQALEKIKAATDQLMVFPLAADTVEKLEEKLPRLLGVRHIAHAQQWQPYATNLYILSLYERAFREKHGPDVELALEAPLIKAVANMVSRTDSVTKKNLQAAAAFGEFKRAYDHRLPPDEAFRDDDHYFFEQILQSKFTQEQFGITKDSLELSAEGAEALFTWAFSKPRAKPAGADDDYEGENVFYKAEAVGLWSRMNGYDLKKSTSFAKVLDVSAPEKAPRIRTIEAQYLAHKERRSAVDTLESLRKALQELKLENLVSQKQHLEPMFDEVAKLVDNFRKMMKAVSE
ncbi:hypothetical protein [Variovorax boronicumulans]